MTEPSPLVTDRKLALRRRMKQRKPKFVRPESWRYVRIKENWRRPRGLDHKVRIRYDGWPPGVSIGYRGPKATRGLHPSGYSEVLVHNVEVLEGIDPEAQVVRIAHTVGRRKKARILAEAKKKRLTVLNLKEAIPKEEKVTEEKLDEEKTETKKTESSEPGQKSDKTRKRKKETKQS
jgi:large subunit ribosomal protein L32e